MASYSSPSFQQGQSIKVIIIVIRSPDFGYKLLDSFEMLEIRHDFVAFINQCCYLIMMGQVSLAMLDSSSFIVAKAGARYFVITV